MVRQASIISLNHASDLGASKKQICMYIEDGILTQKRTAWNLASASDSNRDIHSFPQLSPHPSSLNYRQRCFRLWFLQVQTPLERRTSDLRYTELYNFHRYSLVAECIAIALGRTVSKTELVCMWQRARYALLGEEVLLARYGKGRRDRDSGENGEDGCEMHGEDCVSVQLSRWTRANRPSVSFYNLLNVLVGILDTLRIKFNISDH